MSLPATSRAAGYYAENVVNEIITLHQQLAGDRGTWELHWQEIAERVWPSHSKSFSSLSNYYQNGQKPNQHVFDSTAAIALNRFGAILDSLITPRNQTWHTITSTNALLNKDRQVRLWFEEVNRRIFRFRYAPSANFPSQNQQLYKSIGAFGTGCMFIDQLQDAKGLRYRNVHLGEVYFRENHQGMIDTILRYFPMTFRQVMQKWPTTAPDLVREGVKANPERKTNIIHAVMPRTDRDPERMDYKGMRFAEYYVALEGRGLLGESGYSCLPYATSRYEQSPGEVNGRSPAMDVLPAIKTLNEQKKTMLKQGHRTVDPVLLAYDDGIVDSFSLRPGAINAGGVTADGRALVHALPVGRLEAGKELMDDDRNDVKDAFLVNIFQILAETPTMTATEVLERTREKGILLAPTIGRQQSEYLGPMIEREISLMVQQRLLPPMPQLLVEAGTEYELTYDSPLSRSQRAEEAAGLMRSVELAIKVATEAQNPEPLDWYDWDVIVPEISDIQGVPSKWMKTLDQVKAVRAGRQQQQAQEQAMRAAPGAAAIIKATGKQQLAQANENGMSPQQ